MDLEAKDLPNARERLFISDRAQCVLTIWEKLFADAHRHSVVLDLHQKVDGLEEMELGGDKIGTTGKGNYPQTTLSGLFLNLFEELGHATVPKFRGVVFALQIYSVKSCSRIKWENSRGSSFRLITSLWTSYRVLICALANAHTRKYQILPNRISKPPG